MSERVYYYLSDYSDEVVPHTPTLDGIREWLSGPDPACGRKRAARPGERFDLDILTILGWRKATWTGTEWVLDGEFPSTDFLAVVENYGDTSWHAEEILYGETLDRMLRNHIADNGGSPEERSPIWIVCAEGNRQPLSLTYNGPDRTPDVCAKVIQ
jgi:hypothetical protein